jgi:SAM-dependent MidA family methyltransferase
VPADDRRGCLADPARDKTVNLAEIISRRIASEGPITVADYMQECLLHPTLGYYTTRPAIGNEGDFITAPEISQMFGELIGLCLAQAWIDQGCPAPFTLAELGPGRGTLMTDALRAARQVPGFVEATQIVLVEASERLRGIQQQALRDHPVAFLQNADALPERPLFLVANEFFDALPIRQFLRAEHCWQEHRVGVRDSVLTLGLGPEMPQPFLAHRLADTKPGDCVEYAPSAAPIIAEISDRIARYGGAGLIIDYGDWRSLGDTWQALRAHEKTDPLAEPGAADLTAHVDFEALVMAARCAVTRLTPQGVFLERLGITQRAQALAQKLSGSALEAHIAAHRRLTHPAEMGNLFKVQGLFPEGHRPPPGLNV